MKTKDEGNYKELLLNKLKKRKANIGVVGLGYVGLPLSLTFAEKGFQVLGIDIDQRKVESINAGNSYIHHIKNERVKNVANKGLIEATTNFSKAKVIDALILCVPTPLNKYREPDLSYIVSTVDSLLPNLRQGQLLSLESTTYPGTTQEVLKPMIESKGFRLGIDFFLTYSPEREDPSNQNYDTSNIPKVMGGSTSSCQEVGLGLYQTVVNQVVCVSDTKTAEMTKLLENIHRAVNIGLMNELKPLTDRMGIDLYEVIKAAATKPFGFVPYYPGPGLGGHCIPIDPFYLAWKAREYGMHTRFIELAGEINKSMPSYVLEKTVDALNESRKSIKESNILILGISYKKNVDDVRESPALEIIQKLVEKGANVKFSDPYFKSFPHTRNCKIDIDCIEISPENIKFFDLVILVTDHDSFDYEVILQNSSIIIDTRGRFEVSSKVIRA